MVICEIMIYFKFSIVFNDLCRGTSMFSTGWQTPESTPIMRKPASACPSESNKIGTEVAASSPDSYAPPIQGGFECRF